MRKQTRAWLELAILLMLVCFLLLLAYYKMLTLSASITAFASLIIARYTMLLAYVGEKTNELQEQIAGLQGDAVKVAEGSNVIQLWAQKIATNPDLKVFVQGHWQSSNHMQLNQMDEQGNVARTSFTANWQANLLLWNTGTGTILVKSWDVDDETGRRNLWIRSGHGSPNDDTPAPTRSLSGAGSVERANYLRGASNASLHICNISRGPTHHRCEDRGELTNPRGFLCTVN